MNARPARMAALLALAAVVAVLVAWRAPGSARRVIAPGQQQHIEHVRSTRA